MSTSQVTGHQTFMPFSKQGNILSLVENSAGQSTSDSYRLLHLASQLQSSLSVEEILSNFSHEIQPFLPHHNVSYRLEQTASQQGIDIATSKPARYRLKYELILNKENLGSLEISRRSKFRGHETHEAETLISTLLYPLRNALMYRAAINAARKDALTGVGNRAAFDEAFNRQVELAHRHDRSMGMIVIDIDHFKKINDSYGHATGDTLLKTLARTTGQTIRASDQVFRYGGEEFVVLLPETSKSGIKLLAERIRQNIEAVDCVSKGRHIKMTASFGIAILKEDETETDFFARADKALYKAKADGRNCIRMAR